MLAFIRLRDVLTGSLLFTVAACAGEPNSAAPATANTNPVAVVTPIATQTAIAGVTYSFDFTRGNTTFSDPRNTGLTYTVT